MSRPQTAEADLRAAFERLKSGSLTKLPAGSRVNLTNVAAEAGRRPSSLRKDRYPRLYNEITAYRDRQSVSPKKVKPKKPKTCSTKLVKRLRRDNSKLTSIVNVLTAINEELMRENELLKEGKVVSAKR